MRGKKKTNQDPYHLRNSNPMGEIRQQTHRYNVSNGVPLIRNEHGIKKKKRSLTTRRVTMAMISRVLATQAIFYVVLPLALRSYTSSYQLSATLSSSCKTTTTTKYKSAEV